MKQSQQDTDTSLRRLLDEREIAALLFRYAAALDHKDWAMLASCFLDDATADYESIGHVTGYPAIESVCRQALAPMSQTQHLIGNVMIEVDQDHAISRCYFQAQHVRSGYPGGEMNIIAGRYEDQLARTESGWRIRHRRLRIQWTFGNAAIHELPAQS